MSDTTPGKTLGERLLAIAYTVLPKPLQELHKQGMVLSVVAALFIVVVVPLLVAFLAAFWLSLAKASNVGVLQSLRRTYVKHIYEGFGTDEEFTQNAKLLNARLDYLQVLDFTLGADDSSLPTPRIKNVNIQVERWQRVVVQLTHVSLDIPDDTCKIKERDTEGDLLDVAIGGKKFISCPQTYTLVGGCVEEFDERWWKEYGDEFRGRGPEVAQVMKFSRSPNIRESCGRVHVEGTLAVYKDIYAQTPATRP